jgi:hypothetical protein
MMVVVSLTLVFVYYSHSFSLHYLFLYNDLVMNDLDEKKTLFFHYSLLLKYLLHHYSILVLYYDENH